ncbi:hypothetical protein PSA7680_00114 [Pseudoruegeria aquimaris]|uniref:Chromosome partition protein Smc n=1 Tax=Pseudoruegeria aquimaris TaxID=393663 RepID=A0A1Y5RC47_9RHOB|nr:hypothetical protein [Pseudoruegeria aquimaris]SLN11220.1 hypothetical protein PSA7680_00114 [Pseudoruegeria aquimaris]
MSDITEIEARIRAALDRIEAVAEAGAPQPAAAGSAEGEALEALRAELEAERSANQSLEARVAAIREKQEENVAALQRSVEELKAQLDAAERESQKLRAANAQLTESLEALRNANAENVGEPFLINRSMMAELEALRAARNAEKRELDSVLTALEGAIGEGE